MIKVGINGFGRIGRFVFRAAMKRNDIQIVGINDLCPVDYLAYMLKYDTMHGQFDGTIEADVENSKLIVNGQAIRITAERNPADLKWNEVEAEYVVESTGLFLSKDKAQAHIEAGAKYVVMSAPSKDALRCSFAVLTKRLTLRVLNSYLTLLVLPTAWLLSLRY